MKKIFSIVLNNFKNDSRVLKENISLNKAGYDVKILALHEEPLKEKEIIQNIPVHRIKLKTRKWSKNKLIQIIKYCELLYVIIRYYRKADIYHCNDLGALPIGVIIKKIFNKKAKIVYDAHEYETEVYGLTGIEKRINKVLERWLIKYVDSFITVSYSIANAYVKLYEIEKPYLILNCPYYTNDIPKKDIFRTLFKIKDESTIFIYQGGLSSGRGIELILEVFSKIKDKSKVVIFMGYGPLQDKIKKYTEIEENIFFHKAVPQNLIIEYTNSADIGFSLIEDTCLSYAFCLPNKIFEYIMADIPVIASNGLLEVKRFIQKYKIGLTTDHNFDSVYNIVNKIKKEDLIIYRKNLDTVKKIYNWEKQEEDLLLLYKNLS
jgi:glycosyltransferase involved in cell wall biosynthesis